MVLLMEEAVIDAASLLAHENSRRGLSARSLLSTTIPKADETKLPSRPGKQKSPEYGCCSSTVSPLPVPFPRVLPSSHSLSPAPLLTNCLLASTFFPLLRRVLHLPLPHPVILSLIISENRVHRPSPKWSPTNIDPLLTRPPVLPSNLSFPSSSSS